MIKIIADTGADFTKEQLEENEIELLPIFIIKDEVEYRDTYDITADEIYENQRKGVVYKTSRPLFSEVYEKFLEHAK